MPELGSGIHAFRPVEIDADAAEEYWAKIQGNPESGVTTEADSRSLIPIPRLAILAEKPHDSADQP